MAHEDLQTAGGSHRTCPVQQTLAFVWMVTSQLPSALKKGWGEARFGDNVESSSYRMGRGSFTPHKYRECCFHTQYRLTLEFSKLPNFTVYIVESIFTSKKIWNIKYNNFDINDKFQKHKWNKQNYDNRKLKKIVNIKLPYLLINNIKLQTIRQFSHLKFI